MPARAVACSRCTWLDRGDGSAGAVVSFLRTVRWAPVAEIAAAIGTWHRNAVSALVKLERAGRVRRELEELDADGPWRCGGARYLYQLTS